MAVRVVGAKFEFTGDAAKAKAAFKAVAEAAGKTGAAADQAAKDIEQAFKRQEAAARKAEASSLLRQAQAGGGLFGAARAGATARIENVANQSGLGGVLAGLGGAENLLSGISSKATVAAGAGVALGAALAKGGQLAVDSYIRTVDQVDKVRRSLGGTAEEASNVVGIFRGLGLDVDSTSQELKEMAQNITANERELNKYGVIVARTAEGNVDLHETLLNAASAYQAQTDPAIKARIAAQTFGGEWDKMVKVLQTSRSTLQEFSSLAPSISDSDIDQVRKFREELAELRNTAQGVGVEVGRPLVEGLTFGMERVSDTISGVSDLLHGNFSDAFSDSEDDAERAGSAFAKAADNMLALALAGGSASIPVEKLGNTLLLASEKASAAAARFAAVFNTQTTAISAQLRFKSAVDALAQVQTSGAASASKYADAQDNVAKAVSDGQADIAKAVRDGARQVEDAQEEQARTIVDNARRIAEAEERGAERITDAYERVEEARRRAADASQDAADRVEDARRALVDAATAAAGEDNPLEARRRIEDAQLALNRALRDQTQSAEESARDIAESESELGETRQDTAKEIAEAKREAAEASIEAENRLAEAQVQAAERVAEAQKSAAERVQGAQQSLTGAIDTGAVSVQNMTGKVDDLVKSTFDAAFQIREAGGSQDEINAKVREGKDALDLYGESLGLTNDQVAYYKQLLDLIPLQVRTKVKIEFETIVRSATGLASNAIAAAAATAIAQQIQIPQFAGGGTFRASQPGGAGLAVLHDGEKVTTPEDETGGVVNHYHIHGGLVLERELPALIRRVERRGFK